MAAGTSPGAAEFRQPKNQPQPTQFSGKVKLSLVRVDIRLDASKGGPDEENSVAPAPPAADRSGARPAIRGQPGWNPRSPIEDCSRESPAQTGGLLRHRPPGRLATLSWRTGL